jgi:hypothetical protein
MSPLPIRGIVVTTLAFTLAMDSLKLAVLACSGVVSIAMSAPSKQVDRGFDPASWLLVGLGRTGPRSSSLLRVNEGRGGGGGREIEIEIGEKIADHRGPASLRVV